MRGVAVRHGQFGAFIASHISESTVDDNLWIRLSARPVGGSVKRHPELTPGSVLHVARQALRSRSCLGFKHQRLAQEAEALQVEEAVPLR